MNFEVVGPIRLIETIAAGKGIRESRRLVRTYGVAFWRKRKGFATVRWPDGRLQAVEVHWYGAHGVGRKELKIKRIVDRPRA